MTREPPRAAFSEAQKAREPPPTDINVCMGRHPLGDEQHLLVLQLGMSQCSIKMQNFILEVYFCSVIILDISLQATVRAAANVAGG